MSTDYKATLFLPRTDFPMRGNLPKREPDHLRRWAETDLYGRLRETSRGREKFILHDGPPYANGNLHMGHAMNKVLKDVINRFQQMQGKDAPYVPGWDCHGLPIEWKIEEKYRKKGRNKDDVPAVEFRRECREFAEHWIDVQREEFKRLGVVGDWDNPYTTMAYDAEAQIVRELLKFLMDGSLYKGAKAVMWSVVEKTSLAEAEIEYHDHVSNTIFVRFPVQPGQDPALEGVDVVIWTTTPWTMPGNRAVAYKGDISYGIYEVTAADDDALAVPGDRLLLADALAESVFSEAGVSGWKRLGDAPALEGVVLSHPLAAQGFTHDVPLLEADFVTTDQGTGLVHVAPGHGADDYELGRKHGLEVPDTVDEGGVFYDHVPLLAGRHVFKADPVVIDALKAAGRLLAHGKINHSYPHSWRSKAPLIFRAAPQWFISMDRNGLREKALAAIEATDFYPPSGKARLYDMVSKRPDWLVSRQRAWGVPITVYVNRRTGEPLRDEKVNQRIVEAIEAESCDAWFTSDDARFLAPDYDPADFEKVTDILDVWFDSGSTHSFVLEKRPELSWPADLYLEGTDQHRGWFHSSLLEACGTRGRAPYKGVLTHGFLLDAEGRKMSKSIGNTITPQQIIKDFGADILRLWVVASDYTEDLRVGTEIMRSHADTYRRFRNTLRYLLGNLDGFREEERLPAEDMPELDRWVLHRLAELDGLVRKAGNEYDFHSIYVALNNFCTLDLSAFYFDIRKDALYCDGADSVRRRAARTVLDEVFSRLTAWLAPILCFTAEEAWLARHGADADSVHLRLFPETPAGWRDDALAAKWQRIRAVRRVVTGALEIERREKRIGSSLQARPHIWVDAETVALLDGVDIGELCITSGAVLAVGEGPDDAFRLEDVPGVAVLPSLAEGEKCARCWMIAGDVGADEHHPDLCGRCAGTLSGALAGA